MQRRLFVLSGLWAICFGHPEAVAQIGVPMPFDDSVAGGRRLQENIERAYRALAVEGRLVPGSRGVDVADVVGKSIKIGAQFSHAEEILRSAGFLIGSRPDANAVAGPNRPRDWYAVVASLPLAPTGPFQKATTYVTLLPPRPGDYSIVAGLAANVVVSLP
jgi:hypothetical protein